MGVSVGTLSIHLRLSLNRTYSVREKGKTDGAANGTYYAAYVFPPPSSCGSFVDLASDMSTLRKYESLKGKRKLPVGRTTKFHIPMDSLLKIDAMSGSLLAAVESLDKIYMDVFLTNFPVL